MAQSGEEKWRLAFWIMTGGFVFAISIGISEHYRNSQEFTSVRKEIVGGMREILSSSDSKFERVQLEIEKNRLKMEDRFIEHDRKIVELISNVKILINETRDEY